MPTDELRTKVLAAVDKDARVRLIIGLMRDNAWPSWPESRRFRQWLGELWDVADSTVKTYSAEAHRAIALDPEERAEMQEQVAQRLLQISEQARTSINAQTGLPDFPSAIRATESAAKFLGIEPATKVNVSGAVTLESVEELRKRVLED